MNDGAPYLQIDPNYLLQNEIKQQLRTLYGISPGTPEFDPTRDYDAQEKSYAAFLQARYEFPLIGAIRVDGLVGARLTRTDRTISGAGRVTDPETSTSSIVAVNRSTSDTDLLPNASARVVFGGGLRSRFNYSKTLSRPSFGQLNPGLSYVISYVNTIQNSGSGGNPDLRPQKADSFDASLEYYFGRSNYVSAVAFYRDITDRVITGTEVRTIDGLQYIISTPRNLGSATVKGIELSAQVFLDFLPEGLNGLGLLGNFTVVDSEATTPDDPLEELELLGVSKYNYNAGLIYERYGISGRLIYTYRSQYYDSDITNGLSLRPISIPIGLNGVRAAGRLDFGLNYDLTDDIVISFAGTNINGQATRTFESREDFVRDIRNDDMTYSLGIRFNF